MFSILSSVAFSGQTLLMALGIGLVAALIVTLVMRGQLKSVRPKNTAAEYIRSGSMQVTISHDTFLYRNVTRTPRPKPQDKK